MDENNEISDGMRIGIDGRLWNQTGIGRYIKNLCINLQKIDHKNEYVLFILSEDKNDVEKCIKNKNWKIITANFRWHSIMEQLNFPRLINKENLDIMHFTYQQAVPIRYKKPYIFTIHDLIKHHFITGKSSTDPIWLYGFKMLAYKTLINLASKNAKKIIAVSKSTQDEIFDHLIVNKGKVEVVYEAADDFKLEKGEKPETNNYFLYVGNVYAHKNVDKLIKAFKIVSENNNIKLVFIGNNDYFYKRLKKDYSKLIELGKVKVVENISDKELSSYYSNAVCLIRPSLMEGFSLPPLEAMNCECLVLASDIPVHREIFGNNIIYFNPNDPVDLEKQMNYVLNLSKPEKEKRVREGKLLAKKYSWEKTAKETLRIYESSSRL